MSIGGSLISPAVLATLQNTLTPEGVLSQLEAEQARQQEAMRVNVQKALGEAGAAQQSYQSAAAAPVQEVNPLEALITRIGSSTASIISGDKAYAERGQQSLEQKHADLVRTRMDNLAALKAGWDQKAAAARELGNLEAEISARAKSEQIAKVHAKMLEDQRAQHAKERGDADNAAAMARVKQQGQNALDLERLRQSNGGLAGGNNAEDYFTEYVDSRGRTVRYLNQNKVPSIKDRNAAVVYARGKGAPVLTQKQEDGLSLLREAFQNIEGIGYSAIGEQNPETGQYEGGFLPDKWFDKKRVTNRFEALAQTNPEIAAFPAYRTAAINIIQSLASLGPGLRINQAEINAALKYDIPNIGDTRGTAIKKLGNLRQMLEHVEDTLLNRQSEKKTGGKGGGLSFEDEVRQAMEGS